VEEADDSRPTVKKTSKLGLQNLTVAKRPRACEMALQQSERSKQTRGHPRKGVRDGSYHEERLSTALDNPPRKTCNGGGFLKRTEGA